MQMVQAAVAAVPESVAGPHDRKVRMRGRARKLSSPYPVLCKGERSRKPAAASLCLPCLCRGFWRRSSTQRTTKDGTGWCRLRMLLGSLECSVAEPIGLRGLWCRRWCLLPDRRHGCPSHSLPASRCQPAAPRPS